MQPSWAVFFQDVWHCDDAQWCLSELCAVALLPAADNSSWGAFLGGLAPASKQTYMPTQHKYRTALQRFGFDCCAA
jgi:hypothetical protein